MKKIKRTNKKIGKGKKEVVITPTGTETDPPPPPPPPPDDGGNRND